MCNCENVIHGIFFIKNHNWIKRAPAFPDPTPTLIDRLPLN
jgi:hypothetical protein